MEKKFKPGDIAYVSVNVCEDKPADWDYNVMISDKGGGSLKFCVNRRRTLFRCRLRNKHRLAS